MGLRDGGTHYHGPLAGIGTGVAAILFGVVVLLLAWHRVAAQVATGITVLVYVVISAVGGLTLIALAAAALWLRDRARPAVPPAVRAEIVDDTPQAVEEAPRQAAIGPPRVYLNVNPDQLAAALIRQQVTVTQLPSDEEGRTAP